MGGGTLHTRVLAWGCFLQEQDLVLHGVPWSTPMMSSVWEDLNAIGVNCRLRVYEACKVWQQQEGCRHSLSQAPVIRMVTSQGKSWSVVAARTPSVTLLPEGFGLCEQGDLRISRHLLRCN